jgi:hypothetical protein
LPWDVSLSQSLQLWHLGEDKVVAVKQQIESEHAEIIVRIMEMRASGLSFARIAKILKAEGVPAPQRKYKRRILSCY